MDRGAGRPVAGRLPGADRARTVRLLGVGWDNTVWLVDERWTVRFPRRAAALPLLERELLVLRALAGRLPLPVPEPAHVAGPYGRLPVAVLGRPGRPGGRAGPRRARRRRPGRPRRPGRAVPRRAARSGATVGPARRPEPPRRHGRPGAVGPRDRRARAVELGLLADRARRVRGARRRGAGPRSRDDGGALPRRPAPAPRAGRAGRSAAERRHRLGRRLPGRPGPRPVLRLRRADRGAARRLPGGVRRGGCCRTGATEVRARV